MIKHGRLYVDGGQRPVIIKEARLWSEVFYIDGSWIRRKRIRNTQVGEPRILPGWEAKKFARFLLRTGKHMTKRTYAVLRSVK